METEMVFAAVCAIVIAIMIVYYAKRPNRFISVSFGSATGIVSLLLLCEFGEMIGIDAVLNVFNLAGAVILGLPYTIFIGIMNFL